MTNEDAWGSREHLLTYYYFLTGAPGTVDGGEQAN